MNANADVAVGASAVPVAARAVAGLLDAGVDEDVAELAPQVRHARINDLAA